MSQITNLLAINSDIPTTELGDELYREKNISLSLLRLDKIHPVISGNKLFKLYHFLEDTLLSNHRRIITFGGAYSNHLSATAFACNQLNIACVGYVRGERPKILSHTLEFCVQNKMRLEFLDRHTYSHAYEKKFTESLVHKFGEHTLIPEGGFSLKGREGAKLIWNYIQPGKYSHICCAIGTATTVAGLIKGNHHGATIVGIPVLKGLKDMQRRFEDLNLSVVKSCDIIQDYHFGGYAKKNNELLSFINSFYDKHNIPLDFVYTGKMMFGIIDLATKNYFPRDSNILCIHTGGLQGNDSLKKASLHF